MEHLGEGNGTPSSVLAWRIPGTEEPGGLQSGTTERLRFHLSLLCIGEGNGNPLQCSCLENPRDREARWAAIYGAAQSQTRLKRLSSSSMEHLGDPTSPSWRRPVLGVHWRDWCWSWDSSTLATSCEEWTHWERPWCWEGLGAVGEGDDRRWDGWMASPTRWTWVWVNSGSWWWTGKPGVLQSMGSRRVGHDWATELNWTEVSLSFILTGSSMCALFAIHFLTHITCESPNS